MVDETAVIEGAADIIERDRRAAGSLRFKPGTIVAGGGERGLGGFEFGDGLGNLAHHGSQNAHIGFDNVEARAEIEIDNGIDALGENLAGLGVGGEQAAHFLDAGLKPRKGAAAGGAFLDQSAPENDDKRQHPGFDGSEAKREIGRSAKSGTAKPNENKDQALHAAPAPKGINSAFLLKV